VIRADRNEAALSPPGYVLDALRGLNESQLRRYPIGAMRGFAETLARRLETQPSRIVVGNGADGVLTAIGHAMLKPRDVAITVTPTFGMYAWVAGITSAQLRTVPYVRRWELDVDALIEACQQARLVILGHPNNPTGEPLDRQTVLRVARELPNTVVVVDEVYLSFGRDSLVPSVDSLPNVVVVGSLSKVAALAGLRVGYAVGPASLVASVRRAMPPYPVGIASLVAGDAYLRGGGATAAYESTLAAQTRRSLSAFATEVGPFAQHVWQGCGNFILMDFADHAVPLAASLRVRGVVVRAFSGPELSGCLRFCALDDPSTERLISAVRDAAKALGMQERRA
jgi:histidinol-phosphate aminotransferase